MQPSTNCFHATIDKIKPGYVFVASVGDDKTVCLAVEPQREGDYPMFLTLFPGHPMLRNRVGILEGNVIGGMPVLVYPTAQFVPSPKLDHLRLEWYAEPPVGSLFLNGNEFSIYAETGRGRAWFACIGGERLNATTMRSAQGIAFTSWEVMIPGPGGEPYPLCVIDAGAVSSIRG